MERLDGALHVALRLLALQLEKARHDEQPVDRDAGYAGNDEAAARRTD